MMTVNRRGTGIILLTFLAGLMLTMMPLPEWAVPFRPAWMAMVLIYWCMAMPLRTGVGIGWLSGLAVDVASGAMLGQYALSHAAMALITNKLHRRVRVFPVWQQAILIMAVIAVHLVMVLIVKGVIGQRIGTLLYWMPAVTSMLLWPWVFALLRAIRRHYKIS
jgi:rod shape-determining protein MreD